ncbi:hypothetical protein BDV32DRAFT_119837 [Aspergillus pseudonomiae]|uniref:Uncharacterized protein n=1 Tax=Aspergillus pseudonomiae TaxID=1506151 RepID=A0A5N7DSU7_9EURO|nr:uncharacterized protein BDV37DRAFT_236212 [Aspergillus pseudonomiae]KAB8262619.1 hypothetical protein BDV32DRAFT_119837 [Aspergillus pseudonomiae]KAE8409537.1 hypothetical protein BDV37DRAFT_236212 [Aspergillus pseudonomiae]
MRVSLIFGPSYAVRPLVLPCTSRQCLQCMPGPATICMRSYHIIHSSRLEECRLGRLHYNKTRAYQKWNRVSGRLCRRSKSFYCVLFVFLPFPISVFELVIPGWLYC